MESTEILGLIKNAVHVRDPRLNHSTPLQMFFKLTLPEIKQ